MEIEQEIFKGTSCQFEQLLPYGFQSIADGYLYEKPIMDDAFKVIVTVSKDGQVQGKMIDLMTGEEFTNFRIQYVFGGFVHEVREAFVATLHAIRENCFVKAPFLGAQANRLTGWIAKQYGDAPAFLWKKTPGTGVFRNPDSQVWYAAILSVDKKKLSIAEEGEVEVLDIKLAEEEIAQLLSQAGFYPAYHMNKKNWISVVLDETVADEQICALIQKSHRFTEQTGEWIIPANPKMWDILHCFDHAKTITWEQLNHIPVNSVVYIYVTSPYSAIFYQCKAIEVNLPAEDAKQAARKQMTLQLQKRYAPNVLPLAVMKQYGLKAVRGPRRVPKEFTAYVQGMQG